MPITDPSNHIASPETSNSTTLRDGFKKLVIDKFKTQANNRDYSYTEYLTMPKEADIRHKDEANAVDQQFTRFTLNWRIISILRGETSKSMRMFLLVSPRSIEMIPEEYGKALLAIINSKVIAYLINMISTNNGVSKDDLGCIPIPNIKRMPLSQLTSLANKYTC